MSMSWADINGDAKADMLCDHPDGRHYAMLSNGDGTFEDLGNFLTGWGCQGEVNWADINGDGRADLLCNNNGNHFGMLSNGEGTYRDLGNFLDRRWCGGSV